MHNHAQPCTTIRWFLLTCLMICCFNFVSAQCYPPQQKKHENPKEALSEEINKASYVFEASCIESYKDTTKEGQPTIVNKYQIHKVFKGDFEGDIVEFTHDGNPKIRTTYDAHYQKKEREYTPKLTKIGTTSTFIISDNKQLPSNDILSLKIGNEVTLTDVRAINLGYIHTTTDRTAVWNHYPDAIYYGLQINDIGVSGSFKNVNNLYDFILPLKSTSMRDITHQNLERPESYWEWKDQQKAKVQSEKKKLPTSTSIKQ